MKNLLKRSLSGAVYVALIIVAVVLGDWWHIALFSLFTLLAVVEFSRISNASTGGAKTLSLVADAVGGLLLFFAVTLMAPPVHYLIALSGVFLLCYFLYLIARLVMQLYTREESPLTNLAFSYMGQMYIALPLGLMSFYYMLPNGKALLLAMFVMIWLSDTGAYCVGSLIGRHKLFPRISPAKSWEGFCGGVVFVIASAFVMKYCFGGWFHDTSISSLCGLGVVVAVFATWGDLVESLIKRSLGVKDSGNILPGHGGILDRIDSLLLVVPSSLLYLWLQN